MHLYTIDILLYLNAFCITTFILFGRVYLFPITTGVPQGSALGPFLFLVFINDMPQHIRNASCNMFADDNSLYTSGVSLTETKENFQSSVNDANLWYKNNHLPVNIMKTLCMVSASVRKLKELNDRCAPLYIQFDGENLKQAQNCIYLGLSVDNDLKWDSQIQRICRNVSYKLSLLNRLRKFLSSEVLRKIYISNIQPCIEYGISVWGHCSDHNKMMIQRLQHRAARTILNNFDYKNVRGHELVKQLRWQTIEQRRDYFTATLMHKCIYNTAPIHLRNNIVMTADTHDIPTRATVNGIIQVPQPNCEIFKTSFRYQSACLWNSLPPELRKLNEINSFKSTYKYLYFYH